MTYIGDCVFIKNLSHHKFQAFVSRDNGGSDHWHTPTDSFKSGRWGHSGWDVIVFRDEKDTWRKGVYMHIKDVTVYITIHAFHDIRVEYGRDRCAALSAISMAMLLFPDFGLLNEPGNTDALRRRTSPQPYTGYCDRVGNASSRRFYAFVSGYQGGGSGWCTLTKSFKDGRWNRAGWEVVVCRDAEDTWRKGVCIHVKDATVYVTISGIGDVGIECGGDEVGVTSGRDDILGNEGGGQSAMTEARLASLGNVCKKRRDDESETLDNEYQPCAKELGEQDIHRFDGWV